ncbi:Haem-binding domain-containing protein [Muriicola jejuensis]|uniref:Cytochrome C n=1 Tax=Muriicola jejuensis TaxID=504488 RepID=A0A6P0UA14_9FLAO|nr:heme-binding domain-containing protein [Muriicola jejuensis]NER10055.1 cytochrome C [Muriicola jejuensis]SMP03378.1 Haem-binding domain-containing protein [Muriicola jejuensis]
MLKKIGILLLIALVVIQFFRPEKNESNDLTYDISTKYEVPEEVDKILRVSCNDCHSNKTEYPWYAEIQPVGWWLNDHVEDGKRHLNFSELTKRPIAIQNHKFEETVEMVEEKEMPLESYTYLGLHPEANLTDAQRVVLIRWAKDQMAFLAENYPVDSLVMPRRR